MADWMRGSTIKIEPDGDGYVITERMPLDYDAAVFLPDLPVYAELRDFSFSLKVRDTFHIFTHRCQPMDKAAALAEYKETDK